MNEIKYHDFPALKSNWVEFSVSEIDKLSSYGNIIINDNLSLHIDISIDHDGHSGINIIKVVDEWFYVNIVTDKIRFYKCDQFYDLIDLIGEIKNL